MQNYRTILVTGAAGFIGSHLTEYLVKKDTKSLLLIVTIQTVIGGG